MHVLLVEDDEPLAASLSNVMQAQGWRVDVSPRGEPVPHSLARDHYDIVVLDLGLPGIDGLETLRRLRAAGHHLPVLVLTARDAIDDRVQGLEMGADDYMGKPFAPVELVARLRALARRHENRRAEIQTLGQLRFDTQAMRAWAGDQPLALTARESVLLQYLLLKTGCIVPREQLSSLVPGWTAGTSDNALELLISRLRAKLEPSGVRLRTVRGLGYLIEAQDPQPGHVG